MRPLFFWAGVAEGVRDGIGRLLDQAGPVGIVPVGRRGDGKRGNDIAFVVMDGRGDAFEAEFGLFVVVSNAVTAYLVEFLSSATRLVRECGVLPGRPVRLA